MKHSHYMPKFVLLAAVAGVIAGALAGCGSSDSPSAAAGDCSKCSASSKDQCNKSYTDCTTQGGPAADCQKAIDVICALSGPFGDAGKKD